VRIGRWSLAVESAVSRDARAERGLAFGIWALRFRRLFGICDLGFGASPAAQTAAKALQPACPSCPAPHW